MVVIKILEATLAAGATTVTFTDSEIPNSLIRVYSTDPDLMPVSQSLTGNTLTITYEAQSSAKGIAVDLIKQGLDIIDNVTSEDADKALSANQGKVLKDAIDSIVIPTVPENITDLDDVDVTDIENNQVLAWNESLQKFINVNQSGGGSGIDFSTSEQDTGLLWIDGRHVYQKTINFGTLPNNSTKSVAHGISNLDYVLYYQGIAKNTNSLFVPLPYVNSPNPTTYNIEFYITSTDLVIVTKADRTPYSTCYVTMLYVKST